MSKIVKVEGQLYGYRCPVCYRDWLSRNSQERKCPFCKAEGTMGAIYTFNSPEFKCKNVTVLNDIEKVR